MYYFRVWANVCLLLLDSNTEDMFFQIPYFLERAPRLLSAPVPWNERSFEDLSYMLGQLFSV